MGKVKTVDFSETIAVVGLLNGFFVNKIISSFGRINLVSN